MLRISKRWPTIVVVWCAVTATTVVWLANVVYLEARRRHQYEPPERIAKSRVKILENVIQGYRSTYGDYPPDLGVLVRPSEPGEPAWLEKKNPWDYNPWHDNGRAWLEKKDLIDPWGRPYIYKRSQRNEKTGVPLIYSTGPDPDNTAAFIRNWE